MAIGDDTIGDIPVGDEAAASEVPAHYSVLKLLFPAEVGGVFDQDITIEAEALDSAMLAIASFGREFFPDTAVETLGDWERLLGLVPAPADTITARRARAAARMREVGGLSKGYFISLAAAMGYTITIEDDLLPFIAGMSVCGDVVGTANAGDAYYWLVNIHSPAPAPELEARFRALKPAHTEAIFIYI